MEFKKRERFIKTRRAAAMDASEKLYTQDYRSTFLCISGIPAFTITITNIIIITFVKKKKSTPPEPPQYLKVTYSL